MLTSRVNENSTPDSVIRLFLYFFFIFAPFKFSLIIQLRVVLHDLDFKFNNTAEWPTVLSSLVALITGVSYNLQISEKVRVTYSDVILFTL